MKDTSSSKALWCICLSLAYKQNSSILAKHINQKINNGVCPFIGSIV